MSRCVYTKLIILLVMVLSIWGIPFESISFAAFRLSVNPSDGGNSMRFGRIDNQAIISKEVHIRITTAETKQYQLFHRLITPFVNQKGETMNRPILSVSSISGSNASGTLYADSPQQLTPSGQLLYTSTNNGLPDAFTLYYTINQERLDRAGLFTGQILFSLRPIGESTQEEFVMNVSFEVTGAFKIKTSTSSGHDFINLSSNDVNRREGYVRIEFEGNLSGSLRVFQEVLEYPRNELNQELPLQALQFFTTSANQSNVPYPNATNLARGRRLIYEAKNENDIVDNILILNDSMANQLKAGSYRGRIRYVIEMLGREEVVGIDIDAQINPVFQLALDYPSGNMSFDHVLQNSGLQTKKVVVTVDSNVGRPYMITQNVRSLLVNEKGKDFDPEHFTLKQEYNEERLGKILFENSSPVAAGENPIYFSDQRGSSVTFDVLYQLEPYTNMEPGDYKTEITYSLNEL